MNLKRSILGASLIPLAMGIAMPKGQGKPKPAVTGEQLFVNRCAPCHGVGGKGGTAYPRQLLGTLSTGELGAFIKKSMPPGPKKCPAPEADKIAGYMHDAFYSPLAQERLRPARVELSRLTVRQFQNSVSDLISGFHPAIPNSAQHGLYATYFKSRSRDTPNKVFERVDPNIDFDFGAGAPDAKNFDPKNFSISWQGSVLAPDTGQYEFSIHSRHSCQLWINDSRYPVADGEVRSTGDPDPKGVVTLLGGRAYSLRMVFTKATQGVDNGKGGTGGPSFVSLQWRRPNHTQEPIPTQFLFPDYMPKTYVVTAPLPPDDRSEGYEKGTSVSKDWDEAVTNAALEAADYVSKNLSQVTGVQDSDKDRVNRLKEYAKDFLERAFRSPLTDDLRRLYIDKQFAAVSTPEEAVKRVVFLGIESPRFLYRGLAAGTPSPYTVASQLSFDLWDSIPDPALEKAAATGRLSTPYQIQAQARRLTQDNRAWSKLRGFLLQWLKVDEVSDIVKDSKQYPTFNANTASDLRTSLELFLQDKAWGKDADYRDLMLSPETYLNGRLAQLYGANLPANAPFQEVPLDPNERAGLITQPYLLSRFAYLSGSSPIHRGVLIVRNLLGRTMNPPPSNFTPLPASAHPDLTTRERVALQTKPQFCSNCHGIINPLGFTLEKFDAIGKLRQTDNGKPIDSTGFYKASDGSSVKFDDAKALAKYLADSDDAHKAFVNKLFLNVVKQPPMAYGPKTLANLEQSFAKNRYSIRELLVDITMATAAPEQSKKG